METIEELKLIAQKKCIECDVDVKAYSIWLTKLVPANMVLVVGAGLLSLVAGASLLVEQEIISKKTAGILAVVSSGFTLIHDRLKCDEHQAECKRLKSLYQGLREDYANLATESQAEELRIKLQTLNSERTKVIKSAKAYPSQRTIEQAKKLLNN